MKSIQEIVQHHREFFKTDQTRSVMYRKDQLKKLLNAIEKYEAEILEALNKDLNKSSFEGYATEVGVVKEELHNTMKNILRWTKKKRVKTPFMHFPSTSAIYQDPYGVVLVMAPWNYPFQLTMIPLIGAIAAGNCVVLKPSEYSFYTAEIIEKICHEIFDERYVSVIRGGREKNQALLDEKFDYLFFTGGSTVGKLVMQSASKHLTPLTLELGGKSPCIVDETANISLAAKRIVWGKFLNSGQTCVAPDYILIDQKVKDLFVQEMKKWITQFYGEHPEENVDYPKIINQKHFDRLQTLFSEGNLLFGGRVNTETRQIAPTLIDQVKLESPLMQEEIFGPILPIIPYTDFEEVFPFISDRPTPLALYLFTTKSSHEKKVMSTLAFGGGCVNDVVIHVSSPYLPFGGVGASGLGGYHGKASFDTFTHSKSVMKKANFLDVFLRYPPFKDHLRWLKKFMK